MGAVKKKNRLGHRDRSWKIFLAVMAVIALIPLVYALSLSVRTQNSIYDPRLFVTDLTIGNYIKAISDNPTILNNFISSLVISVISQQLQCFAHPWQSMDFPERRYTEKLLFIT